MSNDDINKAYVSPYDKFLFEFDQKHEKTASQLKEIRKNARIAKLRNDPNATDAQDELWKDF